MRRNVKLILHIAVKIPEAFGASGMVSEEIIPQFPENRDQQRRQHVGHLEGLFFDEVKIEIEEETEVYKDLT